MDDMSLATDPIYREGKNEKSLIELLKEHDNFTYLILHLPELSNYEKCEKSSKEYKEQMHKYFTNESCIQPCPKLLRKYNLTATPNSLSFPEILEILETKLAFHGFGIPFFEFHLSNALEVLVTLGLFKEELKETIKDGQIVVVKSYVNDNEYTKTLIKRSMAVFGVSIHKEQMVSNEDKFYLQKTLEELKEIKWDKNLSNLIKNYDKIPSQYKKIN